MYGIEITKRITTTVGVGNHRLLILFPHSRFHLRFHRFIDDIAASFTPPSIVLQTIAHNTRIVDPFTLVDFEATRTTIDPTQPAPACFFRAHNLTAFSQALSTPLLTRCSEDNAEQFRSMYGMDASESQIFKNEALQLLLRAKSVLDELRIPFWISSGTMLGWLRQVSLWWWCSCCGRGGRDLRILGERTTYRCLFLSFDLFPLNWCLRYLPQHASSPDIDDNLVILVLLFNLFFHAHASSATSLATQPMLTLAYSSKTTKHRSSPPCATMDSYSRIDLAHTKTVLSCHSSWNESNSTCSSFTTIPSQIHTGMVVRRQGQGKDKG